uniref:Plastid-encoded RNA polymerase subunit alpha n=1 Tax=Prasiola crispa TaxID=173492 RepID=A0A0R8S1Q3_PRACR|nr:alpha subunit of RNA polymerase [Prasiola crispa]
MEHLLLSCIESRIESDRNLYSRFQLGPFDKGQGLTIANVMRRTLLSELSGFAIVCVEIPGVSHEYSNLKGIRESVLDLLLNLKQIVLISKNGNITPEIGFLKVQGPAIIKAGDLKLPGHFQCADPSQYIATLSDNGSLEMKFMICKGKNFLIQTPFELITQKFQLHFSAENYKFSSISVPLTYQNSKTIPFKTDYTNGSITYRKKNKYQKLKNQIIFKDSYISKLDQANQPKSKFEEPIIGAKKNRLKSFLDLCSKRQVLKVSRIKTQRKKQRISENFLDKKFFKRVEKNLLYSNLNISEFQSFRNLVYTQNLKRNSITNILLVDCAFMPVLKVNFSIQNINKFYKVKSRTLLEEFQKKTIQEKIFLEVWTNGSIYPKSAIYIASKRIIDLFLPFQKTYLTKSLSTTITTPTDFISKKHLASNVSERKNLSSLKNNFNINYLKLRDNSLKNSSQIPCLYKKPRVSKNFSGAVRKSSGFLAQKLETIAKHKKNILKPAWPFSSENTRFIKPRFFKQNKS